MATAENSRQAARRRRILERGSDRLALITGRIQSLPPPTHSDQSPSATCPPSDTINHEDEGSTPLLHNDDLSSEISEKSIGLGPLIPGCETGEDASKVPSLNFDIREQPSPFSSTSQDTHDSTPEHHLEPITRCFEFCTLKEISSAVTSTEWTRLYCALAAAIIVVFSYVGLPIFGSYIINGVISFRPLWLLILTNISILALHILSEQQRRSRVGRGQSATTSGSGLNHLGDVLETGLLLKKVTESLFMDCSIFSVVVICGISILKTLGW